MADTARTGFWLFMPMLLVTTKGPGHVRAQPYQSPNSVTRTRFLYKEPLCRTQDIFSEGSATGEKIFVTLVFTSPENTVLYAKKLFGFIGFILISSESLRVK